MAEATVALSGGKDSAAAVLLLRERGYEVRAVHMRLGLAGDEERVEKVRRLAEALAVPLDIVDVEREFSQSVLAHFLAAYRSGRTPNPCVLCNREIKYGLLFDRVRENRLGTWFATGHYACRWQRDGRTFLREHPESGKSQTYFLSMIHPDALERTLFPLAEVTLAAVRRRVKGLPLANVRESQDACFLEGGTLSEYLRRRLPEGFVPGAIVDPDGREIGRHDGVLRFTVGQRRGTGVAAGRRLYVIRIDAAVHTVTMGEEKHLHNVDLQTEKPHFWRPLQAGEKLKVKIRYAHAGEEAEILEASDLHITARFRQPVRALTPGQFAVFYEGDLVVAAGEISKEIP